jgi:phosphomannomutase
MGGVFKAYDVRGIYPKELNEELAYAIGRALPSILEPSDLEHGGPRVVVSRDMRPSSEPLTEQLVRGLLEAGLDVLDVGLATTPMNYFAIGYFRAAAGIQVTASHNPAAYNGFKFSRHEARPVSGDTGLPRLEAVVRSGDFPAPSRKGRRLPGDVRRAYREHLLSFVRRPVGSRPLRVAVDAANGMAVIDREIFESLGIELVPLYFELDGTFPNHEANPLKLENLRDLQRLVAQSGAELGVACDGDFDRAAFLNEKGEPVGSDLATALIAGELLAREPGAVIVYDLRSSRAVPEWITEHGGVPVRERVGHSFMKATLRKRNGLFGGELAGHYYFRDHYSADCALLAVIEILNLLWSTGKPLSELIRPLQRYAKSPETNFEVEDPKAVLTELAQTYADGQIDWLDGITVEYPDWWMNVRPSNTEPLLRLVCEAKTPELLSSKMTELTAKLGRPIPH